MVRRESGDQAPVDRAAGRGRGADAVGDDAAAPPARRRRAVRAFADVRDDVSGAPADPGERPRPAALGGGAALGPAPPRQSGDRDRASIGRESCRERVFKYVWISVSAVALTKKKKT